MLEKLIERGSDALGIPLPEGAPGAFRVYYDLLTRRNREFNLTAIEGEAGTAALHFLDSLSLLTLRDFKDKKVVDVGTGPGFPGLPLMIGEPSIALTLIDSTEKKVNFLREVCGELHIGASCLHARAEELGQDPAYREHYDVAVSRAVARLNALAELCLPLVKVGGTFIAMKAQDSEEEIAEAAHAIEVLGGKISEIASYAIPGTDTVRKAVIIEKTAPTPVKYPRRFAKIQKSPL